MNKITFIIMFAAISLIAGDSKWEKRKDSYGNTIQIKRTNWNFEFTGKKFHLGNDCNGTIARGGGSTNISFEKGNKVVIESSSEFQDPEKLECGYPMKYTTDSGAYKISGDQMKVSMNKRKISVKFDKQSKKCKNSTETPQYTEELTMEAYDCKSKDGSVAKVIKLIGADRETDVLYGVLK